MVNSVVAATPATAAEAAPKKDLKGAALQFESLLLAQILKTAREEKGEDSASSTARDMADEHFASALAAQGGVGIARMVTATLQRQSAATTPAKS
jgi:Rod binding domain-containing protein